MSDGPREYLCTSWGYTEAYENFSIDPALCLKNPTKKKKIVLPNCPPLLLGENYTEIKAWQLKSLYETKKCFERTWALKQNI